MKIKPEIKHFSVFKLKCSYVIEKLKFIKFISTVFYLIRTPELKVERCIFRNVQAFFNK